jgi:hypothetical protein
LLWTFAASDTQSGAHSQRWFSRAIAALEQFGIEALGRQGGFDYVQSTAYVTAAVAKALAVRVNRNLPTTS